MEPIHVVIQTKEEFEREKNEKFFAALKIGGWLFTSLLFTSLIWPYFSSETNTLIFMGFFLLFGVADLTSNRNLKSYLKAFLSIPLTVCGLILFFFAFKSLPEKGLFYLSIIIGSIFLSVAYNYIKHYTNLLETLFNRPRIIKNRNKSFNIKSGLLKVLTYFLGVWLSVIFLKFITYSNKVFTIIFTGFVIEVVHKLMIRIVYHKPISANKYFLYWVAIYSVLYLISVTIIINIIPFIVSKTIIQPNILSYLEILLISIIMAVFVQIIEYFRSHRRG